MEFRRVLFRSIIAPAQRTRPGRRVGGRLAIQSLAGAATEGGIAARSDRFAGIAGRQEGAVPRMAVVDRATEIQPRHPARRELELQFGTLGPHAAGIGGDEREGLRRSEEHTSELQSLMRISYAVFCLKKK